MIKKSEPMTDIRRYSLIKPTVNTPFHIDFAWWRANDNNWRVFLHSFLCEEHQALFSDPNQDIEVDWIDPETAEVQRVDGLQQVLIRHCAQQPTFITEHTSLVNSVFKALLASGNRPMTPNELSKIIGKPAQTIVQTLTGRSVYKGIRPVSNPL